MTDARTTYGSRMAAVRIRTGRTSCKKVLPISTAAVRIRKTVVRIRTAAVRIRYLQICNFVGPVRQSYDDRTTLYGCHTISANCVETLRSACDRLAI